MYNEQPMKSSGILKANIGTMGTSKPVSNSKMDNQLANLEKAFCEMREVIKLVEEKLSPILGHSTPLSQDESSEEETLSTLSNTIRGFSNQVRDITAQLVDIKERIEL